MGNHIGCFKVDSVSTIELNNDLENKQDDLTKNYWAPHNFSNTNDFSLNGQYIVGRVVDIYDGDTITCVLNILGSFYKFNIRLAEIDTCEMKSKNENNKMFAQKARSRLYELITESQNALDLHISRKELRDILNKDVYLIKIMCGEFDKYGRLLGWLFNKSNELVIPSDMSNSFNHILIKEKLAYEYKGDTKLTEKQQIEYLS